MSNFDDIPVLIRRLELEISDLDSRITSGSDSSVLERSIKTLVNDWIILEKGLCLGKIPKEMVIKFHRIAQKKLDYEIKHDGWWKFWRVGRKADAKLALKHIAARAQLIYQTISNQKITPLFQRELVQRCFNNKNRRCRFHKIRNFYQRMKPCQILC